MTTPHPAAIKMQLEERLQRLSARVVGLHSISLEGGEALVGFDILTDAAEDGLLWFAFLLPREVSATELREFTAWLAQTGRADDETIH